LFVYVEWPETIKARNIHIHVWFCRAIGSLGDLNGDGVFDIGVGAFQDKDGGAGFGAVYVIMLRTDGKVRYAQKLSASFGGLSSFASLEPSGYFGRSVCAIGDLNGNGVTELVVGAHWTGQANTGAAFVLFLSQTQCRTQAPSLAPLANTTFTSSDPASSTLVTGSVEFWIGVFCVVVLVVAIVWRAAAGVYYKETLSMKSSECAENSSDPWTRGSSIALPALGSARDYESFGEDGVSGVLVDPSPVAVAVAVPIDDFTPMRIPPRKQTTRLATRLKEAMRLSAQGEAASLDSIVEFDKCAIELREITRASDSEMTLSSLDEVARLDSMVVSDKQNPAPLLLAQRIFSDNRGAEETSFDTRNSQQTNRMTLSSLGEVVSLDSMVVLDKENPAPLLHAQRIASENRGAEDTSFGTCNIRQTNRVTLSPQNEVVSLDSMVVSDKENPAPLLLAQRVVSVHRGVEDTRADTCNSQRTSIDFPVEILATI
jgi:hypothetical protein